MVCADETEAKPNQTAQNVQQGWNEFHREAGCEGAELSRGRSWSYRFRRRLCHGRPPDVVAQQRSTSRRTLGDALAVQSRQSALGDKRERLCEVACRQNRRSGSFCLPVSLVGSHSHILRRSDGTCARTRRTRSNYTPTITPSSRAMPRPTRILRARDDKSRRPSSSGSCAAASCRSSWPSVTPTRSSSVEASCAATTS